MAGEKIIEKIKNNGFTRAELSKIRANAEKKKAQGDAAADQVLALINQSKVTDPYFVFMGFCPAADINNRLDLVWKEQGICEFDYIESTSQLKRYLTIEVGDRIILKKRETFGESMKLYGHGRVIAKVQRPEQGLPPQLAMQWSPQDAVIEVPLMGCNSTIDIRDVDRVEQEMPKDFFAWLDDQRG